MFPWFALLVTGIIWKAFEDFWKEQLGDGEDAIRDKLRSLKASDELSTTPLVKVMAVDNLADTVTILVRGPFKLVKGIEPFFRIEVVISRGEINLTGGDVPIKIKEWLTVIGDLPINQDKGSGEKPVAPSEGKSSKVFEGSMGFGFDRGAWLGEGSAKFGVAPMRIGAAIYGGISDRGMVLGLDAEFPKGAAIPLGPTGLGLRGIGGDFAYNFVARLEAGGQPIPNPTAKDYVVWARDRKRIDRWKDGPIDKTAIGIAIRTVLCTIADQGFVFELNPIGFAFLLPGGAFILGGKGVLLKRPSLGAESYFVIDFGSASLAFGAGVNIEIKSPPEEIFPDLAITTLKGSGLLDVFFSFSDPSAWFFDLGTEAKPVVLEVLTDVPLISIIFSEKAEAYLRINNQRIAFGATLSIGGTLKIKDILEVTARLAAALHAYLGRDPILIRGKLDVFGELSVKVFGFGLFSMTGHAITTVHLPTPMLFRFEVTLKIDLPWPIPDPDIPPVGFGDDIPAKPAITSPLQVGSFTVGGTPTILDSSEPLAPKITAGHSLSERAWLPGTDKLWPDLELIVPFSRRVTDKTGKVTDTGLWLVLICVPGSYVVKEELTKLEIFDLVHNVEVPNVRAIWADGPTEGTTQLRILGTDPLSWLTPHTSFTSVPWNVPVSVVDVFFGFGPPETFSVPRRFDNLLVRPLETEIKLVLSYQPHLVTRVMRANRFELTFLTPGGQPTTVNQVTLFLVGWSQRDQLVTSPSAGETHFHSGGSVVGAVELVVVELNFTQLIQSVKIHSQGGTDLLVYAVRYREAPASDTFDLSKTLLVPGRYRLTIEGKTTAEHPEFNTHPDVFPSAPPVDWRVVREFEIINPESLHTYIYHSTFGDNRRFSRDQHPWTTWTAAGWDPALYGFGLPLYQQYHLVVRFLVPYLSKIFSQIPLKMRVAYDHDGELVQTVSFTPVPDGSHSLPALSEAWILAHGGTVPPDQEVILPVLLTQMGAARLTLFLDHPTNGEVALEDWTGLVSRFAHFREHLSWSGTCLTTFYNASGIQQRPACATLGEPPSLFNADVLDYGIDPLVSGKKTSKSWKEKAVVALLDDDIFMGPVVPFPPELTAVPLDWVLPPAIASHLGLLDASAGIRFARFAAETGVRFSRWNLDPLYGIFRPVSSTTVEALVDAQERPYALWIRTPEPVDWRRVTFHLSIRHVTPATGCPSGYVNRQPFEPKVSVVPSPDGSSAFLVGVFADVPTRLPRGEYTLKLYFNPVKAGLPPLRPSIFVGSGQETVTLRFIQPLGLDWPSPSKGVYLPHGLIELALKYVVFPPHIWTDGYHQQLPVTEIERRIREHLDRATNSPPLAADLPLLPSQFNPLIPPNVSETGNQ